MKDEVRRVLVVDDVSFIADAITAIMRLEATEVVPVGTMAEAMSLIRQTPFDLVILDLKLPDSDPWSTLEAVPAMLALGVKRVVGITAINFDERMVTVASVHGMSDLISKTTRPDLLRMRLKRLFANGHAT